MAEHIEINGIKLLPLKDAAEAFSYSRDHVARLAREQKIVASQVGRQWYVDPLSLKNFAEVSNLESEVRKRQLSLERKREKNLKQELNGIKTHFDYKSKKVRSHAQAAAVSVLLFGLIAGSGFYSALNFLPDQMQSISLARVISNTPAEEKTAGLLVGDFKVIDNDVDLHQVAVVTQVAKKPIFTEEVDIRFLSKDPNQGILVLPKLSEENAQAEIEDLFSDYLIVNFVDEDRGVIVYDKNGESVELPFVAVPVDEEKGDETSDLEAKAINL